MQRIQCHVVCLAANSRPGSQIRSQNQTQTPGSRPNIYQFAAKPHPHAEGRTRAEIKSKSFFLQIRILGVVRPLLPKKNNLIFQTFVTPIINKFTVCILSSTKFTAAVYNTSILKMKRNKLTRKVMGLGECFAVRTTFDFGRIWQYPRQNPV